MKFWQGKFNEGLDTAVCQFISTFSYDKRLYKHDVMGSIAHVTMLAEEGIIDEREAKTIQKTITQIFYDVTSGKLPLENANNVYEFIDLELNKRLGPIAEKASIGRTNTDRAALNTRMYVIELTDDVAATLKGLIEVLVQVAENYELTVVPSSYRGTKSQPTTLAHSIMAFAEMFLRDVERLLTLKKSSSVMPLYSCYGTGLRLPVNRKRVAELLGFKTVSANSADAIVDIDYVYEFINDANLIMKHVTALCNTLGEWQKAAYYNCDGSFNVDSLVTPQCDVPAVFETLKTKASRCQALYNALYEIDPKSLSYNGALDAVAEIIFEAESYVKNSTSILIAYVASLQFDEQAMLKAATIGYTTALDCVDYLIMRGASKSDAYTLTGKVCEFCAENNKRLDTLDLDAYQAISPLFEVDIVSAMRLKNATRLRKNDGEPGDVAVRSEIRTLQRKLAKLFPNG